jgi:hypothetical protein
MKKVKWTSENKLMSGRNVVFTLLRGGGPREYMVASDLSDFRWHSKWFYADDLPGARIEAQRLFSEAMLGKAKQFQVLAGMVGGGVSDVAPAGRFDLEVEV